MQQVPIDTEPDHEYDVERPASKHIFKRPFLIRTRKNAGNDDYTSLLPPDPDGLRSDQKQRSRGWAIVQVVALVMVALSLTVVLHPMMMEASHKLGKGGLASNSTSVVTVSDPGSDDGDGGAVDPSKPAVSETSSPTSEPTDAEAVVEDGTWIRPGALKPHHVDVPETYSPTTEAPISAEPTERDAVAATDAPTHGSTDRPTHGPTHGPTRRTTGWPTPHPVSRVTPSPTRKTTVWPTVHQTTNPTDTAFMVYTESPTPLSQVSGSGTHGGEGPEKDATTLQRRCSTGYQTPHERSMYTLDAYQTALHAGFGNCGPDDEGPTSLSKTVEHFSDKHPTYGDSGDGWMYLAPAKKSVGVRHVSLPFHAISSDGNPRTVGGDEFVLTFQGWTTSSKSLNYEVVAIKTAVVARDLGDGTYDAFLAVPDVPFQYVELTLAHYYTCHEGFFEKKVHKTEYTALESMGPEEVSAHEEFNKLVLAVDLEEDYGWWSEDLPEEVEGLDRRWVSVPECAAGQTGTDGLTNGIWGERVGAGEKLNDVGADAEWLPLCCRGPSKESMVSGAGHDPVRIGDATLPHPTLEVGDVYDVREPHHNEWINYLLTLHEKSQVDGDVAGAGDVLVLSAGLHYLRTGYDPETSAELVTRMLCQITLFYPGKILWTGSVPVQQQLDPRNIDLTDQNVRLLDADLRHRVEQAGNRLDDICDRSDVERLYGFVNPKNGSARIKAYATHEFHKLNEADGGGENDLAHSENYLKIDHVLQRMTEDGRKELWGDRKVVYADVDRFLRPRPETYEEGDKIHNVKKGVDGSSMLFEGAHEKLFMNMIQMRRADTDM